MPTCRAGGGRQGAATPALVEMFGNLHGGLSSGAAARQAGRSVNRQGRQGGAAWRACLGWQHTRHSMQHGKHSIPQRAHPDGLVQGGSIGSQGALSAIEGIHGADVAKGLLGDGVGVCMAGGSRGQGARAQAMTATDSQGIIACVGRAAQPCGPALPTQPNPAACGRRLHSQAKLTRPSPPYALLMVLVLRDMKIEIAKPMPARKGVTASITSVMSQPWVKAAQHRRAARGVEDRACKAVHREQRGERGRGRIQVGRREASARKIEAGGERAALHPHPHTPEAISLHPPSLSQFQSVPHPLPLPAPHLSAAGLLAAQRPLVVL